LFVSFSGILGIALPVTVIGSTFEEIYKNQQKIKQRKSLNNSMHSELQNLVTAKYKVQEAIGDVQEHLNHLQTLLEDYNEKVDSKIREEKDRFRKHYE